MRGRAARLAAVALLSGAAMSGCARLDVAHNRLREPDLRIERYFLGTTYAHGLFEDRGGRALFGFRALQQGWKHGDDGAFYLQERFLYDNGQRWERTWTFTRSGPGAWEGRAENVAGICRLTFAGDAVRMVYSADMPNGRHTIRLDFDQRLQRLADGVVENRADLRKFGVRVGRITMTFAKPGADNAEVAQIEAMPPFPRPR